MNFVKVDLAKSNKERQYITQNLIKPNCSYCHTKSSEGRYWHTYNCFVYNNFKRQIKHFNHLFKEEIENNSNL